MLTIGSRMKQARLKRNLSQLKLAKLVSSHQQTLCKYETGEQLPSERALHKIAKALNVNIVWLRYGTGKEPNELQSLQNEVEFFKKQFFAVVNYLQIPKRIFSKESMDKVKAK